MEFADKKVIVDTNMILSAAAFGVDLREEIKSMFGGRTKVYITQNIDRELSALGKQSADQARRVAVGRKILGTGVAVLHPRGTDTDAELAEYAREGYIIATNDKALRNRVKRLRGGNIILRQRKFLVAE